MIDPAGACGFRHCAGRSARLAGRGRAGLSVSASDLLGDSTGSCRTTARSGCTAPEPAINCGSSTAAGALGALLRSPYTGSAAAGWCTPVPFGEATENSSVDDSRELCG